MTKWQTFSFGTFFVINNANAVAINDDGKAQT
jgi:hypothetical protein